LRHEEGRSNSAALIGGLALAPAYKHCGCRIVGHSPEKDGTFYCCDHCAEKSGVKGLRDRV
jgi:hypothetical protein